MLNTMIAICTTVSRNEPEVERRALAHRVGDVGRPPATACVPNSMISVIPSETITIATGGVPRRWNGA